MNVFYLHEDPQICAQMHADRHVVKMIVEYGQMMSTAHRVQDGKSHYDKTRKVIHYSKNKDEYVRKGLFPWGRGNQKGPDGEKVVSARAIKHVREMTDIIAGEKCDVNYTPLIPVIIFVVVREDVEIFRPNKEGCSSFCRYLKEADDMGVNLIAIRTKFTQDDENNISVHYDKTLPIEFS